MTDMQLRNEWNKLRQLYDFRLKYLKAVKKGEVADFTSKFQVCSLLHMSSGCLTQLYCTITYCFLSSDIQE